MLHKLASIKKYGEHVTTALFLAGFIFDMIMLPDISHLATRYIGALYLFLIAFLIMFREWVVSRNTASALEQKVYALSTFGISFCSGSALSFICVYSLRSAALSASWPLFLLLFICIFANEFVSTHNYRFTLDIGVLLTAIVFFVIFNLPVLLKVQNDMIFALSIGASIILSLLYLFILQFSSESASYEAPRTYALAIGIPMFVGMLYFLNVIPAVPLSLKESGIYHAIVRTDSGDFIAQGETDTRLFAEYRTAIFHMMPSDTGISFFSNIDTPAELTAPISHTWEYYDTKTMKWVPSTVVSFDIQGGRDAGYRAYSKKENITEGLWRVTVKIGDNRIIGREKFNVIRDGLSALHEIKL